MNEALKKLVAFYIGMELAKSATPVVAEYVAPESFTVKTSVGVSLTPSLHLALQLCGGMVATHLTLSP